MRNRTSSHFFILVLIVLVTAISHYSIYYGALIRGYETSPLTAFRNIGLLDGVGDTADLFESTFSSSKATGPFTRRRF